ncbi:MAG: aldehyde dehydrogenase family protein [bacterium]|nr:aldehyde dehydrogenase family protein [bacterium]
MPSRPISVSSPIDDREVGRVPRQRRADVDATYKRLAKAQPEWAAVPFPERLRTVGILAKVLRRHRRELADLLVREIGKTPAEADGEIVRTAELVEETVREARRMKPERIRAEAFPGFPRGRVQTVERTPLGVVLAIGPFNYPVNLSISKVAPALALGNTVFWKPPTQGSVTCYRLLQLLYAAGFPRDLLRMVTGKSSEIGDYLVTHPQCAMVAMTGSTAVGQRIASLTGMVPLLLELGGNDPAIVLADADLDVAAKHITGGAFKLAGQRCTAVKRVYVVDRVADRLTRKIAAQVEEKFATAGDPREHPVSPVISDDQAKYLRTLLGDAKRRGARIIRGGKVRGRYVEATVLDRVPHSARVVREEQFGPVLPIVRVRDAEQAVRFANDSEYGLQASVFSRSEKRCREIAGRLEAGGIHLNGPDQRAPDNFMFTGHKASGIGAQGVRFALEAMSRPKGVVTNR